MKILILLLSLLSLNSYAQSSKETFCKEHSSLKSIEAKMRSYHNMVNVGNESGFLGMKTGVCWWHSRFQRNVSYLVQMEPSLPKPTDAQAKAIIKKIISGKEIVIIPGFENFRMFSIKYYKQIVSSLTKWINTDFLIRQDWTRAYKGASTLSVGDFQEHMKSIHQQFLANDGILFMILQFNTNIAHSWLMTNMEKVKTGWNLSVVDSQSPLYVYDIYIDDSASSIVPNPKFPKNKEYFNAISHFNQYVAVPYVYQMSELKRNKEVVRKYCEQ